MGIRPQDRGAWRPPVAIGAAAAVFVLAFSHAASARADGPGQEADPPGKSADGIWALGAQSTVVAQSDFGVPGGFRGANSLSPASQGRETFDATLYGGLKPWRGAEIWISPEIDQGFGLSDTLGVAGFLSGEAYKVGQATPYIRLQRVFYRQTIDLGGEEEQVDRDLFTFGSAHLSNRLVFTAGKMSVGDVFDANAYAHDPREDFLNWSIIDTGTFDYAADAWGYSYGAALEWYVGDWTFRGGGYNLSKVPNGPALESNFSQFELVGEVERRYRLFHHTGKLRLTFYDNRGRYGDFADAVREGELTGRTPDLSTVRRYRNHAGASVDWEQPFTDTLGGFVRAGYADGHQQAYEFTDIDRTVAVGVALQGATWGRPDDTVGLAGVVNDISEDFRAYLAAGGLGILIGDGELPHYQTERILETYYSLKAADWAKISFDYQHVENPAYDRNRGPADAVALRLHLQGMTP
jgi:high affinity Mn2+ porin